MSSIDLKALRETIETCIRTDRRFPVFTAADVLQLLDRLEAAEAYREETRTMAEKHGEVLQRIGTALGLLAGADLHREAVRAVKALRHRAEAAERGRDELRADAGRWRWVRACNYEVGSYHPHRTQGWFESLTEADIDAAIAQEGGK